MDSNAIATAVLETLSALRMEVEALRGENAAVRSEMVTVRREMADFSKGGAQGGHYIRGSMLPPPVAREASQGQGGGASSSTIQVIQPLQLPLSPPERFFGDPKRFNVFLGQCRLHFMCKPAVFPDDKSKIAFVMSYLGGNAATWSFPLVERNDPILVDFTKFCDEMKKLFDRKAYSLSLDRELITLKQGTRDLLPYITDFNRLVVETEWPQEKRISLFYQGLRSDLKDVLASVVPLPVTCEGLIDLTVQLDHRLQERKEDKQRGEFKIPYIRPRVLAEGNSSNMTGNDSRQAGGLRGPISAEERQRRRQQKLCMYCGKAGHFIQNCSMRNQTPYKERPVAKKVPVVEWAEEPTEN